MVALTVSGGLEAMGGWCGGDGWNVVQEHVRETEALRTTLHAATVTILSSLDFSLSLSIAITFSLSLPLSLPRKYTHTHTTLHAAAITIHPCSFGAVSVRERQRGVAMGQNTFRSHDSQ